MNCDVPLCRSFQAVTPRMVRDVCSKYIYDKCPAVAAVGEFHCFLVLSQQGQACAVMIFSNLSLLLPSSRTR